MRRSIQACSCYTQLIQGIITRTFGVCSTAQILLLAFERYNSSPAQPSSSSLCGTNSANPLKMGAHFPTVRNENNCHFSHFSFCVCVYIVRFRCANVSLYLRLYIIYTFATLFSTYHQVSFDSHTTNRRDMMRNIRKASGKSIDFQNKQTRTPTMSDARLFYY